MIKLHDPYPIILNELCNINGISKDKLEITLKATKEKIKSLRKSYSTTPCHVDYQDKFLKGAYMLAYFPYYIETVHRVLDNIDDNEVNHIFNNTMNICFFGAGPAPELIGILSYLNLHKPQVEKVDSFLFDAATQWQICRDICVKSLAPYYWNGDLEINTIECNLLKCGSCEHDSCEKVLEKSKLYIMQNCLNDMVYNSKLVINNFRSLFLKLSSGSVFIVIDLNFESVRQLLCGIQEDIKTHNLGKVVMPVSDSSFQYEPSFNIPEELLSYTFDGSPGAIPRKYTKYFSLVLKRK